MIRFFLASIIFPITVVLNGQSLETIIQKGHELAVLTVSISPDSNLVATGSRDKSAKLWEVSTGREVRSFLGHEGSINCIDFTHDGKWMITSSGDQTAKIWEVATGKEVFSTPPADKLLTAAAFSPDSRYFVTGGYPDQAHVWDFKTRKIIKALDVNADQGLGYGINLSFSKDGKWLAIGEDNRVAHVYTTDTWEKKFTFDSDGYCGGCATWVDFSNDNLYLLMSTNSGPVKKYDLRSGKLETLFAEEVSDVVSAEFSPNDKTVMVATKTQVILWNNRSGKEIGRYNPVSDTEITEANFTKSGNEILVASNNNIVSRWNLSTKKVEQQLTGLLNQRDKGGITYDPNFYWESHIAKYIRFKNSIMLSQDGKELIKGKFGTKVKRWDIASGKIIMNYSGLEKAALCYDLSQDGKTLVAGGGDGKIIFWNIETGDTIRVIKAHREPIFDIHFSHDETSVASASWDATFKMFDVKTGERINYTDFQNNSVYNFQFHPSDLYIFIASLDNSLKLVELDTHKPVREFIGHSDIVSSIQVSPDQKQLLSTSWDGSIRLWDIATGLMTKKFIGHRGPVHAAIFSRDGSVIYSAGADRTIRAWDITTAQVVRTFTGHNAEITSLLLGKDDKMLISHSLDGASKFWDLTSGLEFFEHIHFGQKEWMVKNPDGYFNGTQGARQYIHFVNGLKTYGVDQFFDEFYRPDLLPKIFQNRGAKDELKGIQGKLISSPPPGIKIASLQGADAGQAEVLIRITDNGGGIENIKLFHNGKNIPLDHQTLKLPSGKGESSTYRHVVNLVSGTNTFTAVASNKNKIESDPQTIEVISDRTGKNSVCYILSVGINQYKNSKLSLNYARPDAESFGQVLDEKGALFKKIELHSLYDTEASKINIFNKLDELSAKVNQEDVFIFYYAGHGSMVDNQFYFIPSESIRLYDLQSLKKEAIEAVVLQEKLKNIKALKQLIVMDACQSGASVELLATRGAAEEKAIAQLSRSAGIHVMASAGSEQFATEFAELGHGLFTYLLIKALQGDADGAPKDGKVTIYELKSYLDDQVPEMTQKLKGKPQYPYTFSRGQDFPVVIENEK
jgi:WD40 repeat protein